MPRMATRRRASIEGAGTRTSAVSTRSGNRHTSQVAAAPTLNLLAPGAAGWAMPRLDGVVGSHKVWRGDRVAAAIGDSMLRSGIATGESWALRNVSTTLRQSAKEFTEYRRTDFVVC